MRVASARPSLDRREYSNAGAGCRKIEFSKNEPDYRRCGARAGVSVANNTLGSPGAGYYADHPGYFCGCPISKVSSLESCGLVNFLDFCGVSIQVDPTCVSGMIRSYLSSGTKMYLTWYTGGVVLKATGKVVVIAGKAVGLGQFINELGNAASKYTGSLIKSRGSANRAIS